jgi:YesN/AraC family two-component response regulator
MALILLIDDEPEIRSVLRRILLSAGHGVIEAENGKLGLRRLHSDHPDLVITDILMPEKGGIEAIEEIRRAVPAPKIIAMSGGGRYKGFEYLEIAKWLGADALLVKPFRAASLLETVDQVLGPRD